jgi:hypothetical protein
MDLCRRSLFFFLRAILGEVAKFATLLHLTLVILSRDLLVDDEDEGVPVDPSFLDFNAVFLSDVP